MAESSVAQRGHSLCPCCYCVCLLCQHRKYEKRSSPSPSVMRQRCFLCQCLNILLSFSILYYSDHQLSSAGLFSWDPSEIVLASSRLGQQTRIKRQTFQPRLALTKSVQAGSGNDWRPMRDNNHTIRLDEYGKLGNLYLTSISGGARESDIM